MRDLREIREMLGVSPEQMARVLGCHRETLYRLENRATRLTSHRRTQYEVLDRYLDECVGPQAYNDMPALENER